jgi:hypothetical protein
VELINSQERFMTFLCGKAEGSSRKSQEKLCETNQFRRKEESQQQLGSISSAEARLIAVRHLTART